MTGSGDGTVVTETDLRHLRRCVELAAQSVDVGDEPFGSVLVAVDGEVLFEDHNHVLSGDGTRHPEFELSRWAGEHLTSAQRAGATVYTSGEHCPMCSAAHGWVGLGRIVYASSSDQTVTWLAELGVPPAPVRSLPIQQVVPGVQAMVPFPNLPSRSGSCTAGSTGHVELTGRARRLGSLSAPSGCCASAPVPPTAEDRSGVAGCRRPAR
jgi:tRNA(Arg) A34 adenosine deaminase TadA